MFDCPGVFYESLCGSARSCCRRMEQFFKIFLTHRTVIQKSLDLIAAFFFQKFGNIFCFHTFTYNRFSHTFQHVKYLLKNNFCIFRKGIAEEFTVDLYFIKQQIL